MSFKKGWVDQFKTDRSKEETIVRERYAGQPLIQGPKRASRAKAPQSVIIPDEVVAKWPIFMTVQEIAEILRYEPQAVVNLIKRNPLLGAAAKKIGREWRIPRAAFIQFLTELESAHVA